MSSYRISERPKLPWATLRPRVVIFLARLGGVYLMLRAKSRQVSFVKRYQVNRSNAIIG